MSKPKRKFRPDINLQCVLDVLSGVRTPAQVCREENLSSSLLAHWRGQFSEDAVKIFHQKAQQTDAQTHRIAQLERMVGKLTMALDASKKVSNYFDPRSLKNAPWSIN